MNSGVVLVTKHTVLNVQSGGGWGQATVAYGIGLYVVFDSAGLTSNLTLNLVQVAVLQGGKQDLNCVL